MMVTLLCAIVPSALGALLPPSAFAQQEETSSGEEEEEGEDLAGDNMVSDVLDSVDDEEENGEAAAADGDINRQTAVPIINQDQEQEQGAANLALNEALDVTVVEPRSPPTTTPPDDGGQEPECSLEITADKEIYEQGDVVVITITNTGDEPLEFPDAALGLQIKNVDTGEVFPLDAAQVVTTLEPGESRTFEFTYEDLVREIGTGLISATVVSECGGIKEVTFRLSVAPPPEENEKIVFDSFRDGNLEIYVMNADGSDQQRLTNNPALDGIPSLSPDGTKIVFYRDSYIYIMNADGSDQQRLSSLGNENTPSWSPDGRKIVFTSTPEFNNLEIYVMNADGSDPQRLTNSPGYDSYPSWSPDGSKIAFASERDTGQWEIYVMNADGSDPQRLTNNPGSDWWPDWSPDGSKIAFTTLRGGLEEIYVMNAEDGSGQINLSNHPGQDINPSWSPDGTKIAFYSLRDRIAQIYVMNAEDGSGQTRITNNPPDNSNPDWGPVADTID